jgi:hypothetical protein
MKKIAYLLVGIAAAIPASAQLLVYEGFDYPAGADVLNGQNGGIGFTTAWTANTGSPNVSAGTMTYTDDNGLTLVTGGNRAYFDATDPNSVTAGTSSISFRDINLTAATGTTLYFSLLGEQLTGDARAINFAFFAGGTEAISIGHGTNTPAGGPFTWGAFTGGNGANGAYSTASIFDPAFVVMRIDLNVNGDNDRVRLYLNPDLAAEPAVADVDFSDRNAVASFSALTRVRPFAGNSNGTFVASQADFDELRIGATYGSVTPFVPEPATASLLAAGGFLLARRRRQGHR